MDEKTRDASEKMFQQRFVEELSRYKWASPDFLDGNKQKVTVEDLIFHWRVELNRLNAEQLEGIQLTDNEFAQVISKVNQISNSYEAAKLLAIEESKGKIDGIFRDDNPKLSRKQITLTIFKKAEVRGGDSSYKIAREVVSSKGNRFDLVLLINGLPLINIEQKRTDKSLDEAFEQFKRYYREGEYQNNFMAFSQMMVITTEVETRYFATPKSIENFNPTFVFKWSDKENKQVNNWKEVIEKFLMIPMAHQMVGDYLIIDEAKDEENRRHMLMRPYQVYALQAVEGAALGWGNEYKKSHGGFVWHTTGSGKTITSFKTALFLSTRAGLDKVIFLVDRRELDARTSENFKSYAAYEPVSVDDTKSTYHLKKELRSSKSGIVVTTTFKLNSLVKDMIENQDDSLSDKKFVFIIDEAHRTTMGQMMGTIKKYFRKRGLFYGFTGTPLFDENKITGKINEKSELINTTEKLFGPLLHQYTIDEAINDGNVLGFHIDYMNTGEFESYDNLREKIIERILKDYPDKSKRKVEREVHSWSEGAVEKNANKMGILLYQDETHIPKVVTEILDNWDNQSQGKVFNAILTVAYKARVVAYYKEFKEQLQKRNQKLNVAMTFSFDNENDGSYETQIIDMMFKEYAEFTGIEFLKGDKRNGEDAYFEDIVERAVRGGSGRNPRNIDLIIVADQLLTGYDSKYLNTLYVDRSLELQGLVQAYSRTNRVFGKAKEFGTVINFQYPATTREIVETALKLYGSGGKSSLAIVDLYEDAVRKLKLQFEKMEPTLPVPTDWEKIKLDSNAKEKFKVAFLESVEQLNFVKQYYEFQWEDDTFYLTEHEWLQYVGAYKNLFPREESETEVIISLVGKTKLAGSQVIDAAHILNLIGQKVISANGIQFADGETLRIIYEQIQELSDMGEDEQAQLLKEFVDSELMQGKISSEINFDEAFEDWKASKVDNIIIEFAKEWGVDEKLLIESVLEYEVSTPEVIPYLSEIISSADFSEATNQFSTNKLIHSINLTKELSEWMPEIKKKYD